MQRRHSVTIDSAIMYAIVALIAIFLYCINQYTPEIAIPVVILLLAGLAIGALIPNILITWTAIVLTTIGSGLLLLGEVPLYLPLKIILLLVFPISASMMALNRHIFVGLSWILANKKSIERYTSHYDQVTKLQTTHNASKMYQKEIHFIKDKDNLDLGVTITAIHWAHNTQFKQFHRADYDQNIENIAKILKEGRFPSESLYYLHNGNFLIISHTLPDRICRQLNETTKDNLDHIKLIQASPQFKWGTVTVTPTNVKNFLTLEDVVHHLEREMETDIIVEYLKEGGQE